MRASEWIFVGVLLAAFAPAAFALSEVWSQLDYYSHGYLVPGVALWAASSKRAELSTTPARRDSRGWGCLVLATTLYGAGLALDSATTVGLALVIAVAAAILALRGPEWLRVLAFPVGYLLFMVPLPQPWLAPVIVQLQLFVSSLGVELLQLVGVPVFRTGNVIELPGGDSLFVAEACSGITSIVTLLPLAVFLAYFTERGLTRRFVLIGAVFPLALIGNLIRVLGTVLAARRLGAEAATSGPIHDSTGLLTYVLGCLALLAVGGLMRRYFPEPISSYSQ